MLLLITPDATAQLKLHSLRLNEYHIMFCITNQSGGDRDMHLEDDEIYRQKLTTKQETLIFPSDCLLFPKSEQQG